MKYTKLALVLMAVASTLSFGASAQNQPKWLKSKLKPGEIITKGLTIEEARRNAVKELFQMVSLPQETDTCLYNTLKQHDIPFDPSSVILDAAARSSAFVTEKVYQPSEDDSVTVLVSMTPASLEAFNDSIYEDAIGQGIDNLVAARQLRQEGELLKACQKYHEAMEAIVPCMYYQMPTEEGDLGELLLNEYATLFDNISLAYNREQCPMVPGEAVPVGIELKAMQGDVVLKHFPIKVWMRQRDAEVQAENTTDASGSLKVELKRAPKSEKANLLAAIDTDQLSELPANFASPLLQQHINDGQHIKQFTMPFYSFDPTPLYYLAIEPTDTLQALYSLRALLNDKQLGIVETTDSLSADIAVSMKYEAVEGMPVKAGSFKIREDSCNLVLTLHDIYHDTDLMSIPVNGFKVKVPETRTSQKVRELAVREMLKSLLIDAPSRLATLEFDKRKIVYERAQ